MKLVIVPLLSILVISSCGGARFAGDSSHDADSTSHPNPAPVAEPPTPVPTKDPEPPTPTKPVQPENPSKELVFGEDKVFHIGDNNYTDSSCRTEIDTYNLSGTTYRFKFAVLEANTTVNIALNTLCGVDYRSTNFVYLVKNEKEALQSKTVPVNANGISFAPVKLDIGTYTIIVESRRNTSNNNDFDNFIVGNIEVKADKLLQKGEVTAN